MRLMLGSFCRQFSIAVWPLAWSPSVSLLQTTWGALTWLDADWSTVAAPKPLRKPLCRSTPTVIPGLRSSVAIVAGLLPKAALAYCPISSPALKLLVANSASTALCGSVGVSRAMTSTPFFLALSIDGTIALVSLGVIRMPFTPLATMFSIAVTWLALSPSNLPAAICSFAPLALASLVAPSFILTKNGLVSVLVMSPTETWPPPPPAELFELEPQPASVMARTATRAGPSTPGCLAGLRRVLPFDVRLAIQGLLV